jgi:colanic acid biosynthesis glycosyl transferase WcaI
VLQQHIPGFWNIERRSEVNNNRERLLVIGLNYAPEHTGIAPYTTGMAEGLSRDYDVEVLTAHPHYPSWKVAEGYGEWKRREVHNGVLIQRLRHYVPSNPTGVTRILSEASFAMRILAARVRKPDAVIAVSPALLSLVAARLLCAKWRVPLGAVVQDLYSRAMVEVGLLGSGGLSGPVARLEAWALRGAAGIVAIHERFAESMCRNLRVRSELTTVIPNWTHVQPPRGSRAAARQRLGWGNETIVLHAGNMGAKQGLEHVIDAAALVDQEAASVRIVLMGDGSQRRFLEARARPYSSVEFKDPVPNSEFSDVLSAADILLLHERPGVEEMCVPSKLTSYFAAGRPVLAATSESSAAAHEVSVSGAGLVVAPGDPGELLSGLRAMKSSENLDEMGRRGQTYAREQLDQASLVAAYQRWARTLLADKTGALQ